MCKCVFVECSVSVMLLGVWCASVCGVHSVSVMLLSVWCASVCLWSAV